MHVRVDVKYMGQLRKLLQFVVVGETLQVSWQVMLSSFFLETEQLSTPFVYLLL